MKINHNFFSNLSFNIAENNLGKTNKNPSVGCIVVKKGSVISEGVTSLNGRPHAEYNALDKKLDFTGSDLYVTLEPCTHLGLTPPCTNIIYKKKIKRVFYCFDDPDTRTYKKAEKILKRRRIYIKKIKTSKIEFYKSYFLNKIKKIPLIDAKIAISKDFYTISSKSRWITNLRSRDTAHLIRSKYDCIISTSSTINKDNSLLNCRINGLDPYKPDLIIIDRKLKLRKNLRLFTISKKRKTYIFTITNNKKKISFFKKKGIKVIILKNLDSKDDFKTLFNKIFQIGKGRILVEAGLIFLNKLIRFKLLNSLYIFKSSIKLKSKGFNKTSNNLIKQMKLRKEEKVNLGDDKMYKIRIK